MSGIELICRYLSNELNTKEKQKFKEWLDKDRKNQAILNDYKNIWKLSSMARSGNKFDANIGWYNFKRTMAEMDSPLKDESKKTELKELPVQVREFLKAQK
jgi:hypothetical protein